MSVEKRMVSRKEFLKLGGAGLALSAGLPLIAGCGEGVEEVLELGSRRLT
jgi:hypothetical protein